MTSPGLSSSPSIVSPNTSSSPSTAHQSKPVSSRVVPRASAGDIGNVGVSELEDLFQYITRYEPRSIQLESKLRPFIPEYMPSVGEVDAFLKIPRPDGKDDGLGLTRLDEPALIQSDPSVIEMRLKNTLKTNVPLESIMMEIKSIDDINKQSNEVQLWIESVAKLNHSNDNSQHHHPTGSITTKYIPNSYTYIHIYPCLECLILSN